MTNEDYQLEELENAAVNKSNNAKRIAAAAALLATGGAAGYAATTIPFDDGEEHMEKLSEEDLEGVVDSGANQVQTPEPKPQPAQPTQPTHNAKPVEPTEDQVDVNFDKSIHYVDGENTVMTAEEGTINGHKFQLIDVDGDMRADILAYDEDGNGVYNDDEIIQLSQKDQIAMGHATRQHEVVVINNDEVDPEPIQPYPEPYDILDEKDYADNNIHNDFEDEKTGEKYSHDYAENNENYNNNGDVDHYSAGMSEYAMEEDGKEESDYDYNDVAENDMGSDSFEDLGPDSIDIV